MMPINQINAFILWNFYIDEMHKHPLTVVAFAQIPFNKKDNVYLKYLSNEPDALPESCWRLNKQWVKSSAS